MALFAVLCLFGLSLLAQSGRRGKSSKARHRARTERKQDAKRVYLVHADVLHYDQMKMPDYALSRLLTLTAYYDRQRSQPLLTTSSYPTVTQDFGISLKFSLNR